MNERVFERVIDLAGALPGIAEDYEGGRRRQRLRGVLEDIVLRLDCCRPDDFTARAVVVLAEAWLEVLEIDEQDELYAIFDDDDE